MLHELKWWSFCNNIFGLNPNFASPNLLRESFALSIPVLPVSLCMPGLVHGSRRHGKEAWSNRGFDRIFILQHFTTTYACN